MKSLPLFGMLDYKTKKIATAVALSVLIIGIALRFTSYSEGIFVRIIDHFFLTTLLLIAGCKEKVDDERTGLIRRFSSGFSYVMLIMALMFAYLLKVTINPFYLAFGSIALYFLVFYSLEHKNPDMLFIKEGTEINKKRYFKLVLIISLISTVLGLIVGLLMRHYNIGAEFMSRLVS